MILVVLYNYILYLYQILICRTTLLKYLSENYLMLMMNDPTVHFHIIPRYDTVKTFENIKFYDFGYPSMPSLNEGNICNEKVKDQIIKQLKDKI